MDRISDLPDETLSKVLSFLPTKDVMKTMLLSKRFKSLWMLVQRLEFDATTYFPESTYWGAPDPEYWKFCRLVDRSLMSREGQVIQSLYLKLDRHCSTNGDLDIWVGTAVKRGLMELEIEYYCYNRIIIPKSLFTCETLVVLRLKSVRLYVPDLVCLRSLKTLSLISVTHSDESSLLRLLPNCPLLEDLFIQEEYYNELDLILNIALPSLKRLSLLNSSKNSKVTGIVIDAPSLKYFHIVHRSGSLSFDESINIGKVVKANIEVILSRPEKILDSLASVEHFRLCLSASEVVYPVGSCFNRLKHLEVCTCKSEWLDLFMHLLQDSPSLKVIKISQCHPVMNPRPLWNQPSSVPRCLSSNLETLEWINYEGTQAEKDLSTYILKTAVCLQKASFTARSYVPKMKLQMLQELSLSPRVSSTCELVFN